MIERMGTKLGQYFYKCNYIDEDDIDAVRYYVEVFFNEYVHLLLTIILGYCMGKLLETALYLVCFISIRKYSGGYHAKTMAGCNGVAYLFYFVAIYYSKVIPALIIISLTTISIFYLFGNGSCYDENQREFTIIEEQTKKMKILIVALLVLFSFVFSSQYLGLYSITLFEITLLNIIKKRVKT